VTESFAPAMLSVGDRIAATARAIEPILNRVVFAGPPVIDLLATESGSRPLALVFASDSTLQLLATSMVDRLGVDLQKLGLIRTARTATSDRWRVSDELAVELVQVRADDGDSAQLCLEYATLLTLPFAVGGQLVVRIAAAPAMLAIECDAFARRGRSALDSEEFERIVQLIASRPEIERECAVAPAELRAIISGTLAAAARSDSLPFIVQRAIPDAALLPAVAARVRERMVRIAC